MAAPRRVAGASEQVEVKEASGAPDFHVCGHRGPDEVLYLVEADRRLRCATTTSTRA